MEVSQQSAPSPSIVLPAREHDTVPGGQGDFVSTGIDHEVLQPPVPDFSVLSPSARTSFTRVDISGVDAESRPREHGEGEADGEASGVEDERAELQQESVAEPMVPQIPQIALTFLLVSGKRRTMSFEPETTIGRVKELIWNAWPSDWQGEQPPAPVYLRILYLGKILQDDDTLIKLGLPTHVPNSLAPSGSSSQASRPSTPPPSTIVHLSIRSYAPVTSGDTMKKKGRRRRSSGNTTPDAESPDEEGAPGCCYGCVIC